MQLRFGNKKLIFSSVRKDNGAGAESYSKEASAGAALSRIKYHGAGAGV